MNKIIITLFAVLISGSSLVMSADAQYMGNVGSDYYNDKLSSDELEDLQRRIIETDGANPHSTVVIRDPMVTSVGQSYDGLILVFLIIGISISFILGIIYWWRKK